MAPLMTLSSDDIVKVSLLKPTEQEHGTLPSLQEAALLDKEIKPPQVPGSPPEQLEFPRFVEPVE